MHAIRPSPLSKTLSLVPPAVVLVAQHATGAFDAYIKIGDIKGESNTKSHPEWVVVDSIQWGVSRGISSPSGGGTREASSPTVSELVITKRLDKASPQLFLNAVGGSGPIQEVKLELVKSAAGQTVIFYRLTLNDVLVSSQSTSGASGGDVPTETVSLNFAKIKIEYFSTNPDTGVVSPEPEVGFDLTKIKVQ